LSCPQAARSNVDAMTIFKQGEAKLDTAALREAADGDYDPAHLPG
jgi:hypothetical protein